MFNVLYRLEILPTFTAKSSQCIMNRCRNFMEIVPERLYSVSETARLLGVHRCTIYTYINLPEQSLPFIRLPQSARLSFQGTDLIAYKSAGLPKKGRKRKGIII